MKRRDFLSGSAALGISLATCEFHPTSAQMTKTSEGKKASTAAAFDYRLTPPEKGSIPVAFLISEGATVIDFAGPWEVFQDVHVPSRGQSMEEQMPFQLFTVSDTTDVVTGSAGLKIVPDYTFKNAPSPRVVVIPAQGGRSPEMFAWLLKVSETADVIMSVCTGAFILGRSGLLKGKSATTHHDFIDRFVKQFPDIDVKRGLRFVENPKISSAGGLTSGIDLALRVVDRYFGRQVAERTAYYMEYQSKGWIV
ncbi:MAG TPA: DJ-1/PfpI family protein [Pyrinomonadaceae bacterium]|nr:DJ-1/PfpI family protein [Pyrinomonadaceae bacterium]